MAALAPPVERTKACAACGVRKSWSAFYVKARWPDGTVRQPHSRCRDCFNEIKRRKLREGRLADPERYRAYGRATYQRIKSDPERLADYRDKQRERKRRVNGTPPTRFRFGPPVEHEVPLVPAEPFVVWLHTLPFSTTTLGERADVSDRILRRIKRREQEWVAIDTVDRCAMAMGVRIEDIYGEA